MTLSPQGGDQGHYDVVRQQIRNGSIRVTYRMTKEKENGAIIGFYSCAFDVDLATHAIRNMKSKRFLATRLPRCSVKV
jgi:hypothetical protein